MELREIEGYKDGTLTGNPMLGENSPGAMERVVESPGRTDDEDSEYTFQDWFKAVSIPADECAASRPARRGPARNDGYRVLEASIGSMVYKTWLMSTWQSAWNSLIYHEDNGLAEDVPLVYFWTFVMFHSSTLKVLYWLSLYTGLLVIAGGVYMGSIDELLLYFLPSLIVFTMFGPLIRAIKGSTDIKTISADRSHLVLFTSREKHQEEPEGAGGAGKDHSHLSLSNAVRRACTLLRRGIFSSLVTGDGLLNRIQMDYKWQRKFKKNGIVEIRSYVELVENVSSYLRNAQSLDADKQRGRAFYPRAYSSYIIVFGLCFATAFALFSIVYNWASYAIFCDMFEVQDADVEDDSDAVMIRFCNFYIIQLVATGGGVIFFITYWLMIATLFSGLAVMFYGIDLSLALMKCFIIRYQDLRRFSIDNCVVEGSTLLPAEIAEQVKRDAEERYLYINYFLTVSSEIWQPFIVVFLLLNSVSIVVMYIILVRIFSEYGVINLMSLFMLVTSICLVFYMLVLLSSVNTCGALISNSFVYSGLGDFEVIGGRNDWIDYIEKAPLYWKVFGFTFNLTWLAGFLGTVVSSVGAFVVLPYF